MHPILPHSLRYRLAQLTLRLLFGKRPRPYYIAPWQHASIGLNAFLFHNNRVLTFRRAPHLELPNLREAAIGGHIDIETGENLPAALQREITEEAGISIELERINIHQPFKVTLEHNLNYNELHGATNFRLVYIYHLTDTEAAQIKGSSETLEPEFLTEQDIRTLIDSGTFMPEPEPTQLLEAFTTLN